MVKDFGPIYFHTYDMYDFAKQKIIKNTPLKNPDKEFLKEFYLARKENISPYHGRDEDKNLLVIQVEAMQEFVVDLKIQGEEVTPFLNKLKNDSFYFSNIYHQVAGGNTSDAEFLLNTSLYPAVTGSVNYLYPVNSYISLADILNDKGYTARSFHGFESTFWNREIVYRNYGYDKYYSMNDFNLDEKRGWAISDESFFRQSMDYTQENEKFFSFFITLSSHHPYGGFNDIDLDTGDFADSQVGNYLKSIRYVDMAIENLFKNLEDQGILDNTIIVIYGDHSGLYQDQRQLVEKLLDLDGSDLDWKLIQKVPLWIYDGKEGKVIDKIGGQIDIMPTILDLYGLEHPYILGKTLLNGEDAYAVKRDGTVILDGYYYDNLTGILYDTITKEPIENDLLMEKITLRQKELVVSDLIIRKDLINNNKLGEIIK